MPRRALLSACLLLVLGVSACDLGVRKAKARVNAVFEGLQRDAAGGGGYMQSAVASWARGADLLSDQDALAKADEEFRAWAQQKQLYRKIDSYEIVDARPEGGMLSDTAIVSVKVEGTIYRIRVRNEAPMAWAD